MPTVKFWMVSVDAAPHATKRYNDLETAKKEAARLAAKEHNRAYILEAIEAVVPVDNVRWEKADQTADERGRELTAMTATGHEFRP